MTSRARLLSLALAVGLAGAWAGLFFLEHTFLDERDEALSRIAREELSRRDLARFALISDLEARRPDIEHQVNVCARNPFCARADLLLERDGTQLLPRRRLHLTRPTDEVARALALLASPERFDARGYFGDRVLLIDVLRVAVDRGPDAITAATRNLLTHLSNHVLAAPEELASRVVMLEILQGTGRANPEIIAGLVSEGLVATDGTRLVPFFEVIAGRSGELSATEVSTAVDRILPIADAARLSMTELKELLDQPDVQAPPLAANAHGFVDGGWYVWPAEGGHLGTKVDVDELAAEIAGDLIRSAQWPSDASLRFVLAPSAVDGVEIELSSSAGDEARGRVERQFAYKTVLVLLCGLLVFVVMALTAYEERRRGRYVEMKNDFVSTVSHELRTPLASIRLLAETLQRRLKDEERAKDYPARIVQETDRLGHLVENILSFNRIDKGRWTLKRARIALRPVAETVVGELVDRHGDSVEVLDAIHPDLTLDADPELCALLIGNLARNAVSYNQKPSPMVKLDARIEGPFVVISVSDNGPGIPPSDRARIFEPFTRGEGRTEKGSGLGLSLCRKIAELHGGSLDLTSTGPEGTTFTVRLPVSQEAR